MAKSAGKKGGGQRRRNVGVIKKRTRSSTAKTPRSLAKLQVPRVDKTLLRALVRRELPVPARPHVYGLIARYPAWSEAYADILLAESRRKSKST